MKGYEAGVRGAELGPPSTLPLAVAELMPKVIASKGAWELGIRGKPGTLERVVGDRRIRRRMIERGEQLRVGDRLDARPVQGRRAFVIVCVAHRLGPAPACPDRFATPAIRAAWDWCYAETARLELELARPLEFVSQGIYNCRRIDGSSTWSNHAWHNALDGHVAREGGALDDEATTILARRAEDRGFAAEILWHVAGHFGHVHITGAPKRVGVPPCAS